MKDMPSLSFGVVIAFVAPGLLALWGISQYSPLISDWFGETSTDEPSVGGFLLVGLASLSVGVFVSGIRWAVVDSAMKLVGVRPTNRDFSKLADPACLRAFDAMVEGRYRYYQFYSNSLIALFIAYGSWHARHEMWPWERPWVLSLVFVSGIFLFLSARDSLDGYYRDTEQLLGGGR
jgi:hypothetical protein